MDQLNKGEEALLADKDDTEFNDDELIQEIKKRDKKKKDKKSHKKIKHFSEKPTAEATDDKAESLS